MVDSKFTSCFGLADTSMSSMTDCAPTIAAHIIGSVGVRHAEIARDDMKSRAGNNAWTSPRKFKTIRRAVDVED